MAAVNVLCKAVAVYGFGKSAGIFLSAWAQAVLKSNIQQMFRLTMEKDVINVVECSTEES